MFTGIIEEVGRITEAREAGGDLRVRIAACLVTADLAVGDSISVSGCCLTAVEVGPDGFSAELSRETVARTAPRWNAGARVNLERAMAAGGRFGGHVVSGHVEGVGEVTAVRREPGEFVVNVRAPERLARYLVPKGSVTVDGVSLTVVDAGGPGGSDTRLAANEFTLWLIPHTLEATTLGELELGSIVHLEADLIAKYLERLQVMKEPLNVP
jgi:riboflavin synthase